VIKIGMFFHGAINPRQKTSPTLAEHDRKPGVDRKDGSWFADEKGLFQLTRSKFASHKFLQLIYGYESKPWYPSEPQNSW